MNTLRKTTLGLAVAGALLSVTATPAQAAEGVLATSVIELIGVKFLDDEGNTFNNNDFSNVNSTNNAAAAAELDGVIESSGVVSKNSFNLIQAGVPPELAGIDFPFVDASGATLATPTINDLCIGSGCEGLGGDNDFNANLVSSLTGYPIQNRAYADQLILGAVIDYDLNGDGVINDQGVEVEVIDPDTQQAVMVMVYDYITDGAMIGSESTVELVTDGLGTSTSVNTLNSTVDFVWEGGDTKFNIEFDASAYLEAFVGEGFEDALAEAQYTQSYQIIDNTAFDENPDDPFQGVILQWNADDLTVGLQGASDPFSLNDSVQRDNTANGARTSLFGTVGTAKTGFFKASSMFSLINGHNYTLNSITSSYATAKLRIPEPASIALFGLGLLGLSQIRRRK
ncbi:EDSAP-1 family PEP-CTERM protein [Motilimonas pumila]|uniref:PEP-CTERM sorting domain-containing protein n=1 Tax=Motilimonas pumila TaxID=2303987 RepID=A0A418YIG0_9GAMM|nr:EDSAP-1 family PEP-CTERM protein [Motilimonas pumila]RJG50407.1 PEP-CTERM sorting domain-containing protein [Motilimonas pumila]